MNGMKSENANWLLKESVLKGDNPTQATVDLFLEKYRVLVGTRYVKMMKRVMAAIISLATFAIYFLMVFVSHCDPGRDRPNEPLEIDILHALAPAQHPWICTFLVVVAILTCLGFYAQHL